MRTELRSLAYEVFGLLNVYLEVRDDMLGKKWFAWLRPIDFARNAAKLGQVLSGLQNARAKATSLPRESGISIGEDNYLCIMNRYLDSLSSAASQLKSVAEKLSHSTPGDGYTISAFKEEMHSYKQAVDAYEREGETLKSAWDVAKL